MKNFFRLYIDGFKNLNKLGKKLWLIIFIKAFIMFAVLKAFFFPNFLNSKFETDQEKSEYIINQITKEANKHQLDSLSNKNTYQKNIEIK